MEVAPGQQDFCYGASPPIRRRRQKHSCDQCRRGKRACDAGLPPPVFSASDSHGQPFQRSILGRPGDALECTVQPCTNCKRGKKNCTFLWLRDLAGETPQDSKRKRPAETPVSPPRSRSHTFSPLVQHRTHIESLLNTDSQGSEQSLDPPLSLMDPSKEWQDAADLQPRHADQTTASSVHPPRRGFRSNPSSNPESLESGQDYFEQYGTMNPPSVTTTEYDSHPSENRDLGVVEPSNFGNIRRRRTSQPQLRDQAGSGPSLLSHWDLAETTSRHFMTNGLLRIYHDSMENALSCWLTEHNCPYTSVSLRMKPIAALDSEHVTTSEWGSIWSNRIYARVCRLDRAYSSIRNRPLTMNEERMASKALNLAVLSFAAQWAQAGDRSTNSPRTDGNDRNTGLGSYTDAFPLSDEFGRSMQETLWHQTSRLLHEAAGIESFRVVFALIIFSLTQQPLDIAQLSESAKKQKKQGFAELQQIIEADGPPLFLEMGLRQVFSYRRKLEDIERQQTQSPNSDGTCNKQNPLQRQDRETFNLLFWLGVMFDTLSAAMSYRPLVVDDEDSNIAPIKTCDNSSQIFAEPLANYTQPSEWGEFTALEYLQPPNELWGDRFLAVKANTAEPTRWPCSYQLAASTLSDAAPVKVLLFRRVARLQTLLSRRENTAKLESAINDTFHVYDYWNRIYGPFMLDCVTYHDELPPRIQSWYILIAGHWHLATFLLADLIEAIDNNKLSLPTEREARQYSHLVAKLRQENAHAVSDLSRSSLHGSQGRSFTKATEFHFAVNKGALLTEPWTVVLIRSFSRAGYILAKAVASESQSTFVQQAKYKCESCIEALWILGKKSDMAFLAARCLANMLNESHTNIAPSLATNDIQPSVISGKGQSDHISLQQSYSILDGGSYFGTTFSELPVGQGFGRDSGSDYLSDLQSYSMLGDTIIDDDGSSGSPWGSQYYTAPPFDNVDSLLFVDGSMQ